MIVRTIEMLLEYASIILCIHKIAREKIKINIWLIIIFFIEWVSTILVNNEAMSLKVKLLIYLSILVYTKQYVVEEWINAIKTYVIMTVLIFTLQLIFLLIITLFYDNEQYIGIMINVCILSLILFWKDKYREKVVRILSNTTGVTIIVLLYILDLIKVIVLCYRNGFINAKDSIQIWIEMIILSIVLIIWFNEDNKSKHKAKELQMYEMYNQAFEETITTIRVRQHEFENHINAIKCMRYTIHNQEELLSTQEQYCNDVLKDSKIGNLLKLKLDPALIGFLYAKITAAQEEGIIIEFDVHPVNFKGKIETFEMIELIGILFDNAVEALEDKDNKKAILNLVEDESGFILQVANVSMIYSNKEIEKFCTNGYSTKGDKRGIGLTRVKEIIKKSNATLLIKNQIYNGENYLCFRASFK